MNGDGTMRITCKYSTIGFAIIALLGLGIWSGRMHVKAETSDGDSHLVRKPAVSGSFYPSAPDKLRKILRDSLKSAKKEDLRQPIKIIMAPHAGYYYCKESMAAAYKYIEGPAFTFDTIILVGPSHGVPTQAGALSSANSWRTPLGDVQVDTDLSKRFVESSDKIEFDDRAHVQEHCLEVQLPYLIEASGGKPFKIVPILTAGSDPMEHRILGKALVKFAGDPKTLIVISSDLSHYPPASIAEKVDKAILEAVKSLHPREVAEKNLKLMRAGHKGLRCTMCGLGATLSVLHASKGLGVKEARIVSYTHSGMVAGMTQKVVGYGAMVFTSGGKKATKEDSIPMELSFSETSKRELLNMAREAAEKAVEGKWIDYDTSDNPELQVKAGCFVTFKNKGRLRGCIGRFITEEPLWKTVREIAVASATKDSRFFGNPIKLSEFPKLDVEVSVLSPPQLISDPLKEIKLGVHGIIIRDGVSNGTFLPQVATETGWTLEEFLGHCARDKAGIGWEGWKKPSAKVYTYTATIISEKP